MNSEKLIKDLEEIVNKGLDSVAIPYQKGNSIRIKHIAIRKSPKGYLVYDTQDNVQVARTYFKTTAVAIAKNLALGKNIIQQALELDYQMLKHYNDAVFYKNAIKKCNDDFVITIRETRLDIAVLESQEIRKKLDKYIYC
tara:strand:+ start:332 stop:751 length:420 start_codon:yes stop_codon:yes gene_type:complete